VDTIYIILFFAKGGRPWVAAVLVFKRLEETSEAASMDTRAWVASWAASLVWTVYVCEHRNIYIM